MGEFMAVAMKLEFMIKPATIIGFIALIFLLGILKKRFCR